MSVITHISSQLLCCRHQTLLISTQLLQKAALCIRMREGCWDGSAAPWRKTNDVIVCCMYRGWDREEAGCRVITSSQIKNRAAIEGAGMDTADTPG